MAVDDLGAPKSAIWQELLGYLNFSSGATDVQFLRNLNDLFAFAAASGSPGEDPLHTVSQKLHDRLARLADEAPAFQDTAQARSVLHLALEALPPKYRAFHRDLLFHQSDAAIWRPFMVGRALEAVLQQGAPWDETDRILTGAISKLNDYVGHRPVAVLHSTQRMEPYPHEWIRPIPLYIRGAGVGVGRYRELVALALDILAATDPAILSDAYLNPELMDELAMDPRAYEFDHPVNKRPNYHFGQWDPHHLDSQGRYRRFVVQQVTLDALLDRIDHPGDLPREELLLEAAAVLCGTMLMASGTGGSGPDAHDSSTTLSNLLPRIAAYRDAFYKQFVEKLPGDHGQRLREEAVSGKQSLAAARQHLNQQLARRRAAQLEHVHLAVMFARMGYAESALRQARIVPAAAARMACEIQCRVTSAHLNIDVGELDAAAELLQQIEDFLRRAIQCGAIVDPWNMLGFQGQYSLFPAPENSVPDHRVDQLIELIEQIFGLYARLWSESAARGATELEAVVSPRMEKLARVGDRFGSTSVPSIEGFSGAEAYESAHQVAEALRAFHQAGAAAGDIAFWRKQVAHFESPKTYALVVGALWQKPDLVAAMALLMQWLSQAGLIPLKQGEYSFYALAQRWLGEVCAGPSPPTGVAPQDRRALVRKFFELLEANAEDFWQVPTLDLLDTSSTHPSREKPTPGDDSDDDEESSQLYSAAYDDVVYIDSTGDGVDADMLESGSPAATDFELEKEARTVRERLAFLRTVAMLWKKVVLAEGSSPTTPMPTETLSRWLEQAGENEAGLVQLLRSIDAWRIPPPTSSRDSLLEFDRRRGVKDSLIERVVASVTDTADAARSMRAALPGHGSGEPLDEVLRAVFHGDAPGVRQAWPRLLEAVRPQALLYVPLNKGGDPGRLAQARSLQQALRDLLQWMPRLGLLAETCQLIEAIRLMESDNPVGPGAISEFDRLFATGYEALVDALAVGSSDWPAVAADAEKPDNDLVECIEQLTESLLRQWLAHSRTLRLSVLEKIADEKSWKSLVAFIERFGRDLFTQPFLNLGNLRAILHQGVDSWLARLEQDADPQVQYLLLDDLAADKLSRTDAIKHLTLVIEAIVENYGEYRDYNSTTTQSDQGDLLYTLLDFLRLRVHYDRVAWHLKPLLSAHGTLIRRGRSAAAEAWRRALAERTCELADSLQNRYGQLRKQYAMRLPTVADRLAERFIRPLAIDRVRALIQPAMDAVRQHHDGPSAPQPAFELLEQEIDELTQEPTGVGLDVPSWLASLEQEVEERRRAQFRLERSDESSPPIEQVPLTLDDVQRQLTGWEQHPH